VPVPERRTGGRNTTRCRVRRRRYPKHRMRGAALVGRWYLDNSSAFVFLVSILMFVDDLGYCSGAIYVAACLDREVNVFRSVEGEWRWILLTDWPLLRAHFTAT
jgi:hypothetical protein